MHTVESSNIPNKELYPGISLLNQKLYPPKRWPPKNCPPYPNTGYIHRRVIPTEELYITKGYTTPERWKLYSSKICLHHHSRSFSVYIAIEASNHIPTQVTPSGRESILAAHIFSYIHTVELSNIPKQELYPP